MLSILVLLNSAKTRSMKKGGNLLSWYKQAYLIELFPFAERSRGIAIEQLFGRGAGFFSTYVNPIALKAITWKYLAAYCGWIFIEICFVWFLYPETYGRTLEELTFCKFSLFSLFIYFLQKERWSRKVVQGWFRRVRWEKSANEE